MKKFFLFIVIVACWAGFASLGLNPVPETRAMGVIFVFIAGAFILFVELRIKNKGETPTTTAIFSGGCALISLLIAVTLFSNINTNRFGDSVDLFGFFLLSFILIVLPCIIEDSKFTG